MKSLLFGLLFAIVCGSAAIAGPTSASSSSSASPSNGPASHQNEPAGTKTGSTINDRDLDRHYQPPLGQDKNPPPESANSNAQTKPIDYCATYGCSDPGD